MTSNRDTEPSLDWVDVEVHEGVKPGIVVSVRFPPEMAEVVMEAAQKAGVKLTDFVQVATVAAARVTVDE